LGDEFSIQIFSRMNDDQKESALNKKIHQLTKDLEYAKLKIISIKVSHPCIFLNPYILPFTPKT